MGSVDLTGLSGGGAASEKPDRIHWEGRRGFHTQTETIYVDQIKPTRRTPAGQRGCCRGSSALSRCSSGLGNARRTTRAAETRLPDRPGTYTREHRVPAAAASHPLRPREDAQVRDAQQRPPRTVSTCPARPGLWVAGTS